MENQTKQAETIVGDMRKRQEKMADGKRYINYYTFGEGAPTDKSQNEQMKEENQKLNEVNENV